MDKLSRTEPSPASIPAFASVERAQRMESYIQEGLALIKSGLYEQAENHFANRLKARQAAGVDIRWGEIQGITSLLSRKELEMVLTKIAIKSRPGELPSYMCKYGHAGKKMEDTPEVYAPELVREFKYEIALLFAEEWLHLLQRETRGAVAGEKDVEVDIAAYLDKQGFYLSDHFVTRYAPRRDWFIKKHPDREKSIRAFESAQK